MSSFTTPQLYYFKKYDKNFNFSVWGHQFFALGTNTNLIFLHFCQVAKVYRFIQNTSSLVSFDRSFKIFLIIILVRTFIKYLMSNILSKKYCLSIAKRAFSIRWSN